MVKNTSGGNKHKKQKNSSVKKLRPLTYKTEENEGYGQVTTFLGGNMIMVRKLGTKTEFRCRMRKRLSWIHKNDIVLYSVREFESKEVGDILLVYTSEEVLLLKKEKHIQEDVDINDLFTGSDDEDDKNDNKNVDDMEDSEEEVNIDDI